MFTVGNKPELRENRNRSLEVHPGYHRTTNTSSNALHVVDACQKKWINKEEIELSGETEILITQVF